ncbi:MAG: GFA family protein [Myxococcota bacterium]
MTGALTGRCLCGTAQYEVVAEPLTLYACHCTDCQTSSGASFTLILLVPPESIEVRAGAPTPYERTRASGSRKNVFRCPDCLTPLWSARLEGGRFTTVYAGTLDGSASLRPVAHIWTRSAQPWVEIPEGCLRFEQEADSFDSLFRAWKERESPLEREAAV